MFNRFTGCIAALTVVVLAAGTMARAQSIEIISELATFSDAVSKQIKISKGKNITVNAQLGITLGDEKDLLQMTFKIGDKARKIDRWFTMDLLTKLAPKACADATGIGIEMMANPGGPWWFRAKINTQDGKEYSHVLSPQQVEGNMRQRLLAFDLFKNKDGQSLPIDQLRNFSLTGSVPANRALIIKRIFLYRTPKRSLDAPVLFTTNMSRNNLFEPGKNVALNFNCPKGFPSQASGLHCQVRDFFDKVIFEHTFKPQDLKASTCVTEYTPDQPGFYDLQAWWVNDKGQHIEKLSCLRTTGSMPDGHGSFAVMPRTLKQSQQRMQRVGNASFLGLHGGHSNLADMLGVSWRLDTQRWIWLEPEGVANRSNGMANWLHKAIENKPTRPNWMNTIVNLGINLNTPKWAKSDTPNIAPGIKSWDLFMNYFKDVIQKSKHFSSSMEHRIYDLSWEINLNKPGSGIHKPIYYPQDVIEIYRRARQVVDANDPNAILMGPCTSALREYSWNLPLFEQGLLSLLDAYHCHGYHAPPPEKAKIPEHFAKLHKAIRQYNNGKDMDIYITELGYRSMFSSEDRQKDHARWHVRVAGILKGEGIRAYLPFYSYDYPPLSDGSWGICYNLDPKLKFGTKKVSPKAAVPALAVFADQTEGLSPVTRLTQLSTDLWGYVYTSDDQTLAMIWSVYRDHRFVLPVGNVQQVTVTNIMGVSHSLPVINGLVTLDVSPSPIYVRGLSSKLYPKGQTIDANLLATLYPGDQKRIALPQDLQKAEILGSYGTLTAQRDATQLVVKVEPNCPAGLLPLRCQVPGQNEVIKWIAIRQPLELVSSNMLVKGDKFVQRIVLRNHAQQTLDTQLRMTLDNQLQAQLAISLPSDSQKQIDVPLKIDHQASPTHTWHSKLQLLSSTLEPVEQNQTFNLLAAHEIGRPKQGKFNNIATWSGKGTSGKTDNAQATFSWNADALTVDIKVNDDVFDQRNSDGIIWRQDSIQLGFDTHPDLKEVYEPLAGIFTKKIGKLAFALTPQGTLAWRHATHNEEQLPLGEITREFKLKIHRNKSTHMTHYHIVIPWQQIGLDKVQAGKSIGISILVNDSDGPKTKRAMYELFSGLTTKLPQNNGRLLLQ
ncbi:MAG: hypothetical protein JKX85_02490 [Phycisphaeraceae bacterium]|nr:hypothetical protein [Phycisphaeraceae bacterium]